jgi:mannose-6-phosphate isomerase-like protein (cupin superfamily)
MNIEDQPALAIRRLIARQAARNAPYEQSLIKGEVCIDSRALATEGRCLVEWPGTQAREVRWSHHEHADEMFLVWRGQMTIELIARPLARNR